jgi:parallel beta-helix repeat protein
MARLPVPGGDDGKWGSILNQFLQVSHDDEGALLQKAVLTALPPLANEHIASDAAIDQSKIENLIADLNAKFDNESLTSKGDMAVAVSAGTITRFGVGTDGQLLTADSRTETGLRWADATVINVKDFGATGDGNTDDSVAIQSAVSYASTAKGTLHFPAGTYRIDTTISVPGNLRITGDGNMSHLTRTTTGNIFSITGTSETPVSNVHISNLRFSGPSTQANSIVGNGIYMDYASHITIKHCLFQGFGLTDSNDGGISGIRSSYVSVLGNSFRLNTNGVCFGTPGGTIGIDHSLIAHNIALNNWEDGIHTQQCSFLVIDSNITGKNGQVNDGAGIDILRDTNDTISGNLCFENGGNGIEIGSGASADSGHTIGGNSCYQNGGNGISVANLSTKCSIVSNTCISNTGHGINVSPSGTANATMEHILVSNNNIQSSGGNGINISSASATSVVRFSIISGNVVHGNTNHGILLTARVENNQVVNNTVISNSANGIRLSSQSTNIPNNNVISGNLLSGNSTQLGQAGDTNTIAINNKGHNPQGIAAISVGASPFTYTAGSTPEMVYISGGTVTAVSKSSSTLFIQSNVNVRLEPHQSVTVTYTSTPTMVKDRL